MIRIKRFSQILEQWNYDYILNIIKSDGWGGGALQFTDDFEKNDEYSANILNDDEYAEMFRIYLLDLENNRLRGTYNKNPSLKVGKWTGQPTVANRVSIYSKFI
jgi:hypothetical protein